MTAKEIHDRSRYIRMTHAATCIACGQPINRRERAWYAGSKEAGYRCCECGQHPEGAKSEYIPMAAKYEAKCHDCGCGIAVGAPMWWRKARPHRVLCPGCYRPDGWRSKEEAKQEGEAQEMSASEKLSKTAIRPDADGISRITFESVADAITDSQTDYAQNESNRKLIAGRMRSHLTGYDSWANDYTRETLMDCIANPPAHLIASVDAMREAVMEDMRGPVMPRRKVRRGQEFGEELDAERVLARDLTPWERIEREQQPKRTVRVGVDLTVSAGERADALKWRGAAAVALADILTQRGMNVELVAFWSIGSMSRCLKMTVAKYIVKRSDMPLDIGAAAVALAEIAYARVVALYGLSRHVPGRLHEGFGCCETLPRADAAAVDFLMPSGLRSQDSAIQWLKDGLAKVDAQVLHV